VTWADRVARARAAGECVRCGDPHDGPAQVCRACQVEDTGAKADRRDARRAAGLCRCGGAVPCAACQRARVRLAEQRAINVTSDQPQPRSK